MTDGWLAWVHDSVTEALVTLERISEQLGYIADELKRIADASEDAARNQKEEP